MSNLARSCFLSMPACLPCNRSIHCEGARRPFEPGHARKSAFCRATLDTTAVEPIAVVTDKRLIRDTAERLLTMDGNDNKVYFPLGSFNYAVTHAYDGGAYKGWQLQLGHGPNAHSIQGELEKALCRLTGETREDLNMCCSGRTDTGVHATGQVAHFRLRKPAPDLPKFLRGLNALLPADIRALAVRRVPPEFHARYSCVAKTYVYRISNTVVADPFARQLSWHFPYSLDVDAMRRAAQVFEGTHDFTALSNKPRLPSQERDPVKHIHRVTVSSCRSGGISNHNSGISNHSGSSSGSRDSASNGITNTITDGSGGSSWNCGSGNISSGSTDGGPGPGLDMQMGDSRDDGEAGVGSAGGIIRSAGGALWPACGGREITVEVTGDGFLYRMVRRMVWAIVTMFLSCVSPKPETLNPKTVRSGGGYTRVSTHVCRLYQMVCCIVRAGLLNVPFLFFSSSFAHPPPHTHRPSTHPHTQTPAHPHTLCCPSSIQVFPCLVSTPQPSPLPSTPCQADQVVPFS
eukprot:jgi/Mesvir1/26421/Mv16111-RA.1